MGTSIGQPLKIMMLAMITILASAGGKSQVSIVTQSPLPAGKDGRLYAEHFHCDLFRFPTVAGVDGSLSPGMYSEHNLCECRNRLPGDSVRAGEPLLHHQDDKRS